MVLSLVACGGEQEHAEGKTTTPSSQISNDSGTEATENAEQPKWELTYEEGVDYWGFAEVAQPEIPGLTWTPFTAPDGIQVEKATTPFTADMDSAYKALLSNAWLAEVAPHLSLSIAENITTSEYEDGVYGYSLTEFTSIDGTLSEDKTLGDCERFHAQISRNVNFYETPNVIVVDFCDIPAEQVDQAATVEVLTPICGEELANYLVYAKDPDCFKTDGKTALDASVSLSELVAFDGGSYTLLRDVNKKSNDTVTMKFLVQVKENDKIIREGHCYDLGTEFMYETMKYNMSDLLPESFGSVGLVKYADFGVTYFQKLLPGYVASDLKYLNIQTRRNTAGREGHSISGEIGDQDAKDGSANFFFDIYLEEKNGTMSKVYLTLDTGWNDYNLETKSQEYLDRSVEALRLLFPDSSFSDFTYQEGNNNYESTISSNLFGVDVTGTYGVYLFAPRMSITLQS